MTDKTPIQQIEELALAHSKARDVLADRVRAIEEDQAQILRRRRAGIRTALDAYDVTRQLLMKELDENPHLFKKPKTKIMHGMRVGFMKKKGTLIISDEEKTCTTIKKLFPEKFETLVKITRKTIKKPLNQLTVADLKRIGVQVKADTDEAVIKSTDSAIDKLIKAMTDDEWIRDDIEG